MRWSRASETCEIPDGLSVCVLSRISCVWHFAIPWTVASLLCPWDSPGKTTGVGCHALLQGIYPTQGSKLHLLHCRWILIFDTFFKNIKQEWAGLQIEKESTNLWGLEESQDQAAWRLRPQETLERCPPGKPHRPGSWESRKNQRRENEILWGHNLWGQVCRRTQDH